MNDVDILRERLIGAADAALHRALERAGARVRSRIKPKSEVALRLKTTPQADVASQLGRAGLESLGLKVDDLLKENDLATFRHQFNSWASSVQRGPLGYREWQLCRHVWANARVDAWKALHAGLLGQARALLFSFPTTQGFLLDPDERELIAQAVTRALTLNESEIVQVEEAMVAARERARTLST